MNGALHHCSHSKSLVWDWFVPEPLLMPCSCYTCRHGWQLRHCTPRVESHYVHDLHLSDQEPYLLVFAGSKIHREQSHKHNRSCSLDCMLVLFFRLPES